MTTTIRDIRPDAVLKCVSDYLESRGFEVTQADKAELSARMKGFPSAVVCAGFEAREQQFRTVAIDARDVNEGGKVISPKHSLGGTVLAVSDKAGQAFDWAESYAIEHKVPVIVCDGNDSVCATFDEEDSPDVGYSVIRSVGQVRDAEAAEARAIAEDVDLVDAGYCTLRGAFACFTETLKRMRESDESIGSVLFIQNYEGEGQPIVHRAIV